MHPVLEQQLVSEGGGAATQAPPSEGYTAEMIGNIGGFSGNGKVPGVVAGIVLGSIGTLVLLRLAGFRFSFGVNVGGGS